MPNLGLLSKDPLKIEDWVNYENVLVGCAYCGAQMPHAPFPTNSNHFTHRPRCGNCGSFGTYPIRQVPSPSDP